MAEEALLLLQAGLSPAERQACLDALSLHGCVIATMGPLLCVLRTGSVSPDRLRAVPGVRAVIGRDGSGELPASLGDSERLFVAGWLAQGRKQGPRPGAGRDWDAPGFTPPDAP